MIERRFILATAGHVDHGKSALVKALTGIDPDRLPEEKARGITIDLGFAHLELPSTPNLQPSTCHLAIVDVPGHEDFVKNMVAGVGSIDLALLVVAADDGWMPQTEEHLQILTYLGVSRAVVALTKIDLAEDEAVVTAQLRERLADSPFGGAPVVPTSVVTGRGLAELKTALVGVLSCTPLPRDIGKPRLPVDRVFTLRGIGTVVTGTLTGGTLCRGQTVLIQPSGQTTRIRNLQNHNREADASGPGTRVALNLPDVDDPASGVRRGDVVALPESGGPTDTVDVLVEKSARLIGGKIGAARPLKDGSRVRVHFGATNIPARILFLGTDALHAGARALAELRFELPAFAFAGDRFIVRDWAEQTTLAGGIILDADADRKGFRTEAQRIFLEQRAQSPNDTATFAVSQLARDGVASRQLLLLKSRFGDAEISEAVSRLAAERKAEIRGGLVADAAWWQALRQSAMDAIDTAHRSHPEHAGLPLSELRALMVARLTSADVFDALKEDLCRNGFSQVGVTIGRTAHRPALPPQLQAAGGKVRALLSAKPLEPPSRKELAPDALSQQALRFLLQTGEAIELGEGVVLSADGFGQAMESVKNFLQTHGPATAGELRQALGTNRRIVIPLLERLDSVGLTRREGDKRSLRK
jgi:selenocysteine-specific elongation factor